MSGRYHSNSPDDTPAIVVVHWAVDDRTRMLTGGATSFFKVPDGKIGTMFIEPSPVLAPGGVGLVPVLSLRDSPTVLSSGGMMAGGMVAGAHVRHGDARSHDD